MGRNIITYNTLAELNQLLIEKKQNYTVHMHDLCGSQSFTLQTPGDINVTPEEASILKQEVSKFFNEKGMTLKFSQDSLEFTIINT